MTRIEDLIEFKKTLAGDAGDCYYSRFHKGPCGPCEGKFVGIKILSTFIFCEKHLKFTTEVVIEELTLKDLFTLQIL